MPRKPKQSKSEQIILANALLAQNTIPRELNNEVCNTINYCVDTILEISRSETLKDARWSELMAAFEYIDGYVWNDKLTQDKLSTLIKNLKKDDEAIDVCGIAVVQATRNLRVIHKKLQSLRDEDAEGAVVAAMAGKSVGLIEATINNDVSFTVGNLMLQTQILNISQTLREYSKKLEAEFDYHLRALRGNLIHAEKVSEEEKVMFLPKFVLEKWHDRAIKFCDAVERSMKAGDPVASNYYHEAMAFGGEIADYLTGDWSNGQIVPIDEVVATYKRLACARHQFSYDIASLLESFDEDITWFAAEVGRSVDLTRVEGPRVVADNQSAISLAELKRAGVGIGIGIGEPKNNNRVVGEVLKVVLQAPEEKEKTTWFNYENFIRIKNNEKDNARSRLYSELEHSKAWLKNKLSDPGKDAWAKLKADFPNFEEVINFYQSQFRLMKHAGRERIAPVLLLGEPGIGKTQFAQKLAKVLATGYCFVDVPSTTERWVLSGNHPTWSGARQGKIFDTFLNSSTASPVMVFDELEKPVRADHDCKTVLYQLLEETNAKVFHDEFVGFPVDVSRGVYIATANSLGSLPEPLVTRFRVFTVPSPTDEQRKMIAGNIYKEEIGESAIFEKALSDEIHAGFLGLSLREVKNRILEGVGKAIMEYSDDELDELLATGHTIKLGLHHFNIEKPKKATMGFR